MKSSASKIQLTGFDDLFQSGGTAEANGEQVQEVLLTELFPFKDHPFQVRDDEAMQKTVESIVRSGVLSPGIVRPRSEGGYEIIAGHRRKRGSELAGKKTMPVLVRELDDDEATIIMVDSNLQREKILPSEKAFAYKMKMEALKHQGKRQDLTCERGVHKLKSRDKIAQDAGESCGLTVTRYISLTKLIPSLLALVDEDKLSFSTAADYISVLTE
ncbi:MAG: ParB/RepB/Spo0J family partition protein, partial [Oscillospiraceae bacterium]|nr:ParB/RepB/Spo0J family partition protein [Oscillospiraceae bacterium]